MKRKLFYLLPLSLLFLAGCFGNKNSAPTPTLLPSGTFTGQFRRIHKTFRTGVTDTQKANIQLIMETATGFAVTGDTSTVQAGSKGSYYVGLNNYIQFVDNTFPPTGTPTKTHLNGLYQYYYDGSVFQMLATSLDTLSLQYDLKKTGN
jgi:hypothetical protein